MKLPVSVSEQIPFSAVMQLVGWQMKDILQ